MDNNTARELLQLAMAYRERAMAELQGQGGARLEQIRHESETLLAQVRAALMAELETRAAELRTAIGLPAPDSDISRIRHDIAVFNEILRAQRAEQLGQCMALPIEAYPPRIQRLGERLGIWPAKARPAQRRRFTLAGIEILPTRRGFAVWLICLAVAWTASAYYLGILRPFREIRMDASPPRNGIVHVACRNKHMRPVTLFVPGTPDMQAQESSVNYALVLYIREKPESEYRLMPPVPGAWSVQGKELHETTPVEIGPLMTCDLVLSLPKIRETINAPFTNARLVLVRPGGSIAAACEIDNHPPSGI
ncbi:MAG TPA: hypothetical protein PKO36_11480 [Candidatus Hydrogenedentes bacterium]|nr:hypothetical protein [Candidatus Hydrogenedentota bacterium]